MGDGEAENALEAVLCSSGMAALRAEAQSKLDRLEAPDPRSRLDTGWPTALAAVNDALTESERLAARVWPGRRGRRDWSRRASGPTQAGDARGRTEPAGAHRRSVDPDIPRQPAGG